jgi:hypothetical protein
MTTEDEYKQVALALLKYFDVITKEHMAMNEVLRTRPALQSLSRNYLPQAGC